MSNLSTTQRGGLSFPFGETPSGPFLDINDDIRVIPIPTNMKVGDVNAVALREHSGPYKGGWTLVDPGPNIAAARDLWPNLLGDALEGKPVKRVIVTHFHSDHVGMAGWFQNRFKAEMWTPRTTWLAARLIEAQTAQQRITSTQVFLKLCGYRQSMLDAFAGNMNTSDTPVGHPVPTVFRPINQGDVINAGGRDWTITFGHGHAPDHAMLVDEAGGVIIAGDQILPMITPNVGVPPSEVDSDPLGEWLGSCAALKSQLDDKLLVVPGHGAPFHGACERLTTIEQANERALARLEAFISGPRTTIECFEAFYRRDLNPATDAGALAQTFAHLNRLKFSQKIARVKRPDQVFLWTPK